MKKLLRIIILGFILFKSGDLLSQTTYYSQGTGNWNTLTNWNTNSGGGGSNPLAADLISTLNTFIIQNGDGITLNDSLNVSAFTVDNGTLTIGNSTTVLMPVISGTLTVSGTGLITTGSFTATHVITVKGGLVNNGSINFRNNSAQVVNLKLAGTFSLSGTGSSHFNNFEVVSGTITASQALDINGNLIINTGSSFVAGAFTHTVAGNFTVSGSFTSTNSTIILDATLVQSVTNTTTFNNLEIKAGGVTVLTGQTTVNGNFSVSQNTTVNTDQNHTFYQDFIIEDGSSYKASNGEARFYGTTAQNISIGATNAEFDRVLFNGAGLKTITGSLVANDYSYIYAAATIIDNADTWSHSFANGLIVDGTCNLTSPITLKGGTFRKGLDTSSDSFNLGNGADVIIDGYPNISGGDLMNVGGNVTINSGYLVLNTLIQTGPADTLDSRLIGQPGHQFTLKSGTTLYMRGKNNFPEGFDTYTLEVGSVARYDGDFPQTVKGDLTYGHLLLRSKQKTVTGALVIQNNLNLESPDTYGVTLYLGAFNHTIGGNLTDNYDASRPARSCSLVSTGTVTFNGISTNQYIYSRTIGTYSFNNLYITNPSPLTTITKRLYGNIQVANDFSVSNSTDNELLYLVFDVDDGVITGGNQFIIGSNVRYQASGTTNFKTTIESFASVSLDVNSVTQFDGTDQTIPGGFDYGNLYFYGSGIKTMDTDLSIKGDIYNSGYTPVLTTSAPGQVIHIAGDWLLGVNNLNLESSGSVIFDGANQSISATTLPNVVLSGTGTKLLNGNISITGDLTIDNGVDFNADNRYITIYGNWDNNSTGTFHQEYGRTTFSGNAGQNVSIQDPLSSYFYDVYIDKPTNDTLYLLSDVKVERNFRLTDSHGSLNLTTHILAIGGDWYIYNGCSLIYGVGGGLLFNGSSEEQLIRNYNAATIYPPLEFSGSALKRLYDNTFYVGGDFYINHSTVSGEYFDIHVTCDWKNEGGTFNHYNRKVVFDGADQLIDGSTFDDVVFAGTGTKKLNGNISLTGGLQIDSLATLDVSPDNGTNVYSISIEEFWYNNISKIDGTSTGQFIPRTGTVTFIGGNSELYTGDSIDDAGLGINGKQFYNLVVSNNDNNYYTRIYPVNTAGVKTQGCDLRVLNNFTINSGIFYTYWNKVYVGGSLQNLGGYFNMNDYYNVNPVLTLEGAVGNTYFFDPGTTQYVRKVVINGGGEYLLQNNLTVSGNNGDNGVLEVVNGKLDLNHHNISMASTIGDVTVYKNGTLAIDSAAVLSIYQNRYLKNEGGLIEIVGNATTPARVTSVSGNYYFIQDSGQMAAKYFVIENTHDNGLEIKNGTLNSTNNLSNGSFTGGAGNAYITLNGIDLGGNISVAEVIFASGPTYNVERLSGNGIITFTNSTGTLSGSAYEHDGGSLIEWTFPAGIYWDGGASTTSWNDAANWNPDGVPDNAKNVYLNHDFVAGAYQIDISAAEAFSKSLVLEAGGTSIGLVLNGNKLTVNGDLTIKSGATLTQTNPGDSLILKGNWFNAGSYVCNTSPVVFDLLTNTFTLNSTDTIYQLFVRGEEGILYLGSNINIKDSIVFNGATLSAGSRTINLKGDWTVDGGLFNAGTGLVILKGDEPGISQKISGGSFYNFTASSASPKEIVANISVDGTFTIENGAFVDGKTSYIFAGQNWYNYAGETGFDQTGSGTVVFNNGGTSYIGVNTNDKTTIFNNLIIQGSGTKYVRDTIKVKGNIVNQSGTNLWINNDVYIIGTSADNSFSMSGGTLYLAGIDNFPQSFENISLVGGLVDYIADFDQDIYPASYYDLRIRRNTVGIFTTKTITGDIDVAGSLYINDIESLLDVNGFAITLTGGIGFPTGGRQIAWNGGTLTHVGANWTIDPDISELNEFVKKGTGWITLSSDITVTGNVFFFDETDLNMQSFKLNCTEPLKNFGMGSGTVLYSYVADTGATAAPAFPSGFASYSLDETNRTYIRGTENQEIFTGVEYGTIYLYDNSSKTVQINGDLIVKGDFYMSYDGIVFQDNGHDLYISGANIDIRNYTPGNTIYLNGNIDQRLRADGSYTSVSINNLDISGVSSKDLDETLVDINGNIIIHSGATLFSNNNINFSGASFLNEGTFNHTANLFSFDGTDQTIDAGADNNYYGVQFANSGTKSFINHGIDVYNGFFEILNGVTVDMGSLTHHIASTTIDLQGTGAWLINNASLYFDRNGTQYLPAMSLQDIWFSIGGYKYMQGDLSVNDLTIESNVRLRTTETGTGAYDISLTGNWQNQGYFDAYTDTVFFESDATDSKIITSNGSNFNVMIFNKNLTANRIYSLNDNLRFVESMTIGNGATVHLNGNILTVGNDDANNSTVPYLPDGEVLTVESGASLDIDGGASLQFDLNDANPQLNVYGTLSVIGDPGLNANITRSAGATNRGIDINILSGGTVKAKNYHFQYLAPTGFYVHDGATIDPTNNFSDGIWSNMYIYNQYTDPNDNVTVIDTFIYLNIDTDVPGGFPDIQNVTFNHGGTPVVGRHFNVRRNALALNPVTFSGSISGLLAGVTYEMDPAGMIDWPPVSLLTWTGNESSDWFNSKNWNPQVVPDETKNVLIPLATNNPVIFSNGAHCFTLEITNGILGIEAGVDTLHVHNDLQIGSNGILAVEDNAEIEVAGDWNCASNAIFIPGNGGVTFNAPTGSISIQPRNTRFYNLTFDGVATFFFEGTQNYVNGSFTLKKGQFIPNNNNYIITINGDYAQTSGEFVISPNIGFVDFAGTNQLISNGNFSRVEFSNSGTKTISGTFSTNYSNGTEGINTLVVSDNALLTAAPGCSMEINGNVYIEPTAGFDDGDGHHYFYGAHWTGLGSYSGVGTIEFKGATQYLHESEFNNLIISEPGASYKYLRGNVTLSGDLTLNAYSLDADVYQFISTTAGSFTQNANTRLYIKGADNYPTGFGSTDADVTSYTYYSGGIDQTIRGAVYGNLRIDGTNVKTLEDDIVIKGQLYFYDHTVTFDANSKTINLGGDWYNQYSGIFVPGTGEVVFDGAAANQNIYLGTGTDNKFYKLTVDKADNTKYARIAGHDNVIGNQLLVHSGQYYTDNGYTTYVSGNMIAQNAGTFSNTGTYYLNKASGTSNLKLNGSVLNNLTINTAGTVLLEDKLDLVGAYNLEQGLFNGNGKEVYLGNSVDIANIEGEYQVGAGGKLAIGDQCAFTVKSGGVIKVVGETSNNAFVTCRTGRYYFNVESGGTIHAKNYAFDYMRSSGIKINSGAIIDATDNFSDGSFRNPSNGGVCLWIENEQGFTGIGNRIENVAFPDNPGYGTINVRKSTSTLGELEFYNASGLLAGADYENDPFNLIFWTGDVTLTWNGSQSQDWFDKRNWTQSSGVQKFPDENSTVIIPSGSSNIPQIMADSAFAKSITLDPGAFLTVDNSTATAASLFVLNDFQINGTFTMSSNKDTVVVNGNWLRGTNGIFNPGNGTIRFKGIGAKSINNRNSNFYNLEIEMIGSTQILSNTSVLGNFIINSGDFDVTSSNRLLTVNGDFRVNGGHFLAQAAKLVLQGSGSHQINSGGSTLYDLELKNGTYSLYTHDLQINRNFDLTSGILNVDALTLYLGDDSGYDDLSVNGRLNINSDGKLKIGNNASVNIYTGGSIYLTGTLNHEAMLTHRNSGGRYSFTVNSGGTFGANSYRIEYVNSTGIWFKPGSVIGTSPNNFSQGSFSFGASGGRYLFLENNFSDTILITDTYFNSGCTYNAKRSTATTTGIINFKDASGVLAGYFFEDDDHASKTGAIVWSYTDPILTWVGGDTSGSDTQGNRWDNPNNWQDASAGPGVPNSATKVFIYDVSSGSGKSPVLNAGTDNEAKNITIYSGGKLILGGGMNLLISGDLIVDGTLEVSTGSASTIEVGGQYSNSGVFTHGGNSTFVWKTLNNNTISTGGNAFYNLILNSGGGIGSAVFSTESAITIAGDFELLAGSLVISQASHELVVGGDFNMQGSFTNGNSKVTLNGNIAQIINSAVPISFYNLVLSGTGSKSLSVNISVYSLTNNSTLLANDKSINCSTDWAGTGTFAAGTGTVTFNGSTGQVIKKAETFYDLVVQNTSSLSALKLNYSVTVTDKLYLNDGIVETSSSKVLNLSSSTTLESYSNTSYVNGPMSKAGDADFIFPVGTATYYAPLKVSGFTGSSSTFSVQYFDVAPSNRTLLEDGLNNVSDKEYWQLNRTSGTATPKVTLYWYDNVHSGISDYSVLQVADYNSTIPQWQKQGAGDLWYSGIQGYVTSANSINHFGQISFGFAYPVLVWNPVGGSSDWTDPSNWLNGGIPSTIPPSTNTNVTIPDIAGGTVPQIGGTGNKVYNVLIETNGKLRIADNGDIEIDGSYESQSGAVLQLGSNSTVTFKKDMSSSGSLINGLNSSVKFNATIAQQMTLDTCYNLIISGTNNKTLNSNIVVLGDVTIQGVFVAGSHTVNVFGDWLNTGTFTSGTSTVILKGGNNQTVREPSSAGFYNLTINNSGTTAPQVSTANNVLVSGSLSLLSGIIQSTSTAMLSIASTGSVSGGTDQCFVHGPMRKYGVTDFTFPIGKDTMIAPLGISGMSGSGNFEAQFFNSKYSDVTSKSAGITTLSAIEYWDINRTSGTATPYVTLRWTDSSEQQINDHTKLRVAHYYSGSWHDFGNASSAIYADSSGYVRSSVAFTTFSPVTLGSADLSNPLPVELTAFDAKQVGNKVEVDWNTATEFRNDYFTIQRSVNGTQFESIQRIKGNGNSSVPIDYQWMDNDPIIGKGYYRLIQTDYDGSSVYSDIVSVQFYPALKVSISPNPASEYCTVQLPLNMDKGTIRIISNIGKVDKKIEFTESLIKIDISGLQSGSYLMMISTESEFISQKLQVIHE